MNELYQVANQTQGVGLIVLLLVSTAGSLIWLRKYLSRDAADRATDGGRIFIIKMLREQLEEERNRAASFMSALDNANTQIQQLKTEVFELTRQVRELKYILKTQSGDGNDKG